MTADRSSLPAGLLADIENELDVTWRDEATDRKYAAFIAGGIDYLNRRLGESADYTLDGTPRTLLREYVRYARDSALDVFENNYQSMILDMQNDRTVSRYVESTKQAES